jgi:arsenite methyltransferase
MRPLLTSLQADSAAFDALPNGEDLDGLPPLEPLRCALRRVDARFDIDRMLTEAEEDRSLDRVRRYYRASGLGYRLVHSRGGCMHLALTRGATLRPDDHLAQAEAIGRILQATGARRVLEIGCGRGYNLRHLARAHPQVTFTGLDLMPPHIRAARRKARGLPNLEVRAGSFDPIPEDLGRFDLIFAVESLCHAPDLDRAAASIARHLTPGGSLVVFDAVRTGPIHDMSAGIATALRIHEAVVAVSAGFRTREALTSALGRVGLVPQEMRDLTRGVLADTRRLHAHGLRYFTSPAIRIATAILPEALRRNACAALLGPYLVEGAKPGQTPQQAAGPGLAYLALWCRKY